MLEEVLKDAAARQRVRDGGAVGAHLDALTARLIEQGYTRSTLRQFIWVLVALDRWLTREQITLAEFDEEHAEAFVRERSAQGPGTGRRNDGSVVRHLLAYLRAEGAVPPLRQEPHTEISELMDRFEEHLLRERGLSMASVLGGQRFARLFLIECFGGGPLRLRQLDRADISRFLLKHAHTMAPGYARVMVSGLRSFFRFLLQHGEIDRDLAASVPSVANWRLATIPKHLASEDVERVLDSCDLRTAAGRRDHAILLLLARLGLRGGEVLALTLDDLDWRRGEIAVSGKGRRLDRLPIPADVGDALVRYLREDRPASPSRRVFLRARAPHRGLAGPSSVGAVVRRALARAGIDAPTQGAHLLRHSLATTMLGDGASMAEIGEILRHQSTQTTEIYAKVDSHRLRALAQPWPLSGGAR